MLLNKDQIQSIKENKVTFVKNFVTLNRPYDFNLISKLIEENDLQSMSKSNYGGLRDVFQIRGVVNLLKEFNVLFDFFNKTFNYKYDQKNNVDLFLSLISQVGLNGNMVYKVFNDKIVDYHISKGDLIFIPKGVKHKVMGLSSRISMSVGFFNKRN